jgi:hypothetical protein
MSSVRVAVSRRRAAAAVALLLTVLVGCSSGPKAEPHEVAPFDAAAFGDGWKIDNTWFPLQPGTQITFTGKADRGDGLVDHTIITTITDLTVQVEGVTTIVAWDQDLSGGTLVESELAFFAQDRNGTVWAMGEYPEEYEDGKLTGAPSTWIPGVDKARPGIIMQADPRLGTPDYSSGYAPTIEFGDRGKVFAVGGKECVPAGCYENVLEIDEYNTYAPDEGHQRKLYAAGAGNIVVRPAGDQDKESLSLSARTTLDAAGLAKARESVRQLDERGRKDNKVYRQAAPLVPIKA